LGSINTNDIGVHELAPVLFYKKRNKEMKIKLGRKIPEERLQIGCRFDKKIMPKFKYKKIK
jgi:hypothetical protein